MIVAETGRDIDEIRRHLVVTSMGPRLDSRGNAEMGGDGDEKRLLQWGRDLIVAETAGHCEAAMYERITSMGPRLDSRGNATMIGSDRLGLGNFNGAAT